MRVHVVVVGFGVVPGGLRYRSVVGDAAVVDDHRPADQWSQRAEFVGDQQHRAAGVDEGAERRGECLLADGVDAGGRLVEDEQVRCAGQGAGDQSRCCWPPERLATGSRARSASPTAATASATAARSAAPGGAQDAAAGQPPGGDDLA